MVVGQVLLSRNTKITTKGISIHIIVGESSTTFVTMMIMMNAGIRNMGENAMCVILTMETAETIIMEDVELVVMTQDPAQGPMTDDDAAGTISNVIN